MKKFFLLLSFIGLCSCSSFWNLILEKPKVELDHVAVRDPGLKGTTLIFFISVENPNKMEIKIDKINYKVFINNKEITSVAMDKSFIVPGNSKGLVELPLPLEYQKIFADLKDLLFADSTTYKIEGDAELNSFKIPFVEEGRFKLR